MSCRVLVEINILPHVRIAMCQCTNVLVLSSVPWAPWLQGIERFYETVMQGLLRHIKFEGEVASVSADRLLVDVSVFLIPRPSDSCEVYTGCKPRVCEGEVLLPMYHQL